MTSAMLIDDLKKCTPLLSVGILTADMMNLGSEIKLLEKTGVKLLHIDVMDGCIWPKITVGSAFVGGLKTSMLKDIHLLIDKPENQIKNFVKAGADMITFAVESCGDIAGTLEMIGKMKNANEANRDILRGLSLNPATPIDTVKPVIDNVDIVLLLAVGPDTGSRNFLATVPDRIAELKKIKDDILIFVDGAIKKENVTEVATMGPDVIITGSAVFDRKTPKENAMFMLKAIGKKHE